MAAPDRMFISPRWALVRGVRAVDTITASRVLMGFSVRTLGGRRNILWRRTGPHVARQSSENHRRSDGGRSVCRARPDEISLRSAAGDWVGHSRVATVAADRLTSMLAWMP